MEDTDSNINPLALSVLGVMSLVILTAKRPNAVVAFLLTVAFIPLGQEFNLFGLHLYFIRLLIMVGFVRILMRGEIAAFTLVSVDKLFICWVAVGFVCGLLRGPTGETFGIVYDSLGIYFMMRILTPDAKDALVHLRFLALASVVMAFCMVWEAVTHRNPFHLFGGVPEFAFEREGRFRAQGPFQHPILAGTFAATLFPMMVGLLFIDRRDKLRALLGIVSCTICSYVAASSGAILTLIGAVIGLGLWPIRNKMYLIRRGIVVLVIGMTIVMNAPIWYLIAKISDSTGGTGWYRSSLITQAANHFNEWWLIGSSNTANWAFDAYTMIDSGNIDITNNYIAQGLSGGVLMLGLFLAIILKNFKTIGRTLKVGSKPPFDERLVWAFGVALFSHCMAFISVSYFDQIKAFWFWLLAVIAAFSLPKNHQPASEPLPQSMESLYEEHTTASP